MEWKIPLTDTDFDEKEVQAAVKVIESGWLTMGEVTQEFERKFADFIGAKYAFAVSNCTMALHLAHKAVGIEPGDEVICPSLTFVATANSILYAGGCPVFADITSTNDFNISPTDIKSRISERTEAITIVHYAGYPCDMDKILPIAEEFGLKVIEDAAHAVGAEYNGKKCGSLGDIACFSFFSTKNMTTGEGGMVTTNSEELADRIRLMRSHGMTTLTLERHKGHAFSYDVLELGYNYRIDEIRSAIGLVQLDKLEHNNRRRLAMVSSYQKGLAGIPKVKVPFANPCGVSSHHLFPLLLEADASRDKLMEWLKTKGIQSSIHYPPIHLFDFYRRTFGFKENYLPITEDVAKREITLPLYPSMSEPDVQYVCDSIAEYLAQC